MSDDRALAWTHLLPAGIRYVPDGGPEWWRERLGAISIPDGPCVPVVWGDAPIRDWSGTNPAAVVLVNPSGEALSMIRAMSFSHLRRFAVLPRLSNARWLVPLGSRRLTAAALRLYSPYRWRARAAHTGLRVAVRLGVPQWRQDLLLIASNNRSPAEQLLEAVLGNEPAALAMATGALGPVRKVTLAALDRAGRIRAVCKLATSPLACRLVENEATCLRTLACHSSLANHSPRLLADQQIGDGRAVVVEGIDGRRSGTRLSSVHHQLLSSLASGPPQPATASRFLAELAARIRTFQQRDVPLFQLLAWAKETLEGILLPRTIVHGDFAPWNLMVTRGKLMAFDWEYAHCDGLPLLDEIHHLVQVGFLVHDWSIARALAELEQQTATHRLGLDREQIRALQAVYLLDSYLRPLEEGFPSSDVFLARKAELITRLANSVGVPAA